MSPLNEQNFTTNTRPIRLTLRPKEAAEALGVSERTLRELLRTGEIPYAKVSRAVLIPVQGIEDFIARHTQKGGPC